MKTSITTTTVPRFHLVAIKHGLMARQRGMMITSAAKGGSTTNLLRLLSNVTGVKYPRSSRGIDLALHHIGLMLAQTMTPEEEVAQQAERERLIERSRAVCHS
jgi:hypothetical protein